MIETPSQTAGPYIMSKLISPDGKYTAYAYFYFGTEQQTIEITDEDGKLMWQIPYQGELPHYDPRPAIGIYRWSNDSSILYFCYYWSPDGGDIYVQHSCYDLQSIDIKTGNIQSVLLERYRDFAISPDGVQIAYLSCQDESCIVHIQNLSTGSERTTSGISYSSNDYLAIGGIEWSPNGNGLVFHTQDQDYMLQTIYVNLSTMKYKVVKKYPTPYGQPTPAGTISKFKASLDHLSASSLT